MDRVMAIYSETTHPIQVERREGLGIAPGRQESTTAVCVVFLISFFVFVSGAYMIFGDVVGNSRMMYGLGVISILGGNLLFCMGLRLCYNQRPKQGRQTVAPNLPVAPSVESPQLGLADLFNPSEEYPPCYSTLLMSSALSNRTDILYNTGIEVNEGDFSLVTPSLESPPYSPIDDQSALHFFPPSYDEAMQNGL